MPEDSAAVLDALDRAEDAFGGYTTGAPEYEENLDPEANQPSVISSERHAVFSTRVAPSVTTMATIRASSRCRSPPSSEL